MNINEIRTASDFVSSATQNLSHKELCHLVDRLFNHLPKEEQIFLARTMKDSLASAAQKHKELIPLQEKVAALLEQ